jgi:O-methyltransferase
MADGNDSVAALPEGETSPLGKRLVDRLVVPVVRRSTLLQGIFRRVATKVPGIVVPYADEVYAHLRDCFVRNGRVGPYDANARVRIVERFEAIDKNVRVATSPTDGLFLAEAVLAVDAQGDIVECGCFQGGSTSKLSILASVTGRRLVVFDSFAGLPESDAYNRQDLHVRMPSDWVSAWQAGDWAGPLEVVTANVQRWGEYSVCRFVKGWFKDTLLAENLPASIALAFSDVDIPSSARECLSGVWPRLSERGVFFSHDVGFIKVLKELTDDKLWKDVLREPVPIIYGAGYGLGDTSRMLGFIVKGRDISPEYINSLTVDK